MIEFPPKFSSRPPVNPEAKGGAAYTGSWEGSQGLAEDVAYYAKRIREMAVKSIGSLYPKYYISDELLHERPDLQKYKGEQLNISTYIWARTVNSPNPAFKDFKVPLAANFMLSTKAGKEAYIEPIVSGNAYTFKVKVGAPSDLSSVIRGTKSGSSRSSFVCLLSQTPMPFEYFAVREKRED
jgi:putative DNA methylase